jgi:hypothetical protein
MLRTRNMAEGIGLCFKIAKTAPKRKMEKWECLSGKLILIEV